MDRTRPYMQLGDFLRQHREAVKPRQAWIEKGRRRRTPGLRREEVAQLAGISVDWYVRLEQGREALPSAATVDALTEVLELNPAEHSHLLKLARGMPSRSFAREAVPERLQRLMDGLSLPAYILGTRGDILTWNGGAVELFGDFSLIPEDKRNILIQMFTPSEFRRRYINWEANAHWILEAFRQTFDLWSEVPEFSSLVDELRASSAEFAEWWQAHGISPHSSGPRLLLRVQDRRIELEVSTFQSNDNPDLELVVFHVQYPDTPRATV